MLRFQTDIYINCWWPNFKKNAITRHFNTVEVSFGGRLELCFGDVLRERVDSIIKKSNNFQPKLGLTLMVDAGGNTQNIQRPKWLAFNFNYLFSMIVMLFMATWSW